MLPPNRTALITLATLATLAWQGVTLAEAGPGDDGNSQVIAVINGQRVTNIDFITFVNSRIGQSVPPANLSQQQLNALLGEYINRELVYQDAVSRKLDTHPEVVTAIDNQRRNIVAGFALRQIMNAPLSDKALHEAYKNLASKPVKEYKASHIVVSSESQARQLVDQLRQGTDFARLARENSIDSATAQNGGLLGWLAGDNIVPQVRAVVENLKTGSYSTTPVQTQSGWHILRLEETRILPPPEFEKIRDRLSQHLHNEDITKYVNQLRQNSTIEISQEQ